MRFIDTAVAGAYLIDPERHGDERGFFARLWCRDEFASRGLKSEFVQCNGSFSAHKRTLRGLHYQAAPYQELKLMRCVRGAIFDVVVDLRRGSPTYLQWAGAELTAENGMMFYVPEGCAHGYLTLQDGSEVLYPVSQVYHPEAERGIRWDDPLFAITWPEGGPNTVSAKDQAWPDYDFGIEQ